jgi:hypothetical protein
VEDPGSNKEDAAPNNSITEYWTFFQTQGNEIFPKITGGKSARSVTN